MQKARTSINTLAYATGVALACVVLVFVVIWAYFKPVLYQFKFTPDVAFASFGPIHIENRGYTFNASLALQTRPDDARWARDNKKKLNDLLFRALYDTNPEIMRSPAGLVQVQETLAKTANTAFERPYVLQVLFTDFVIQTD